VMLEPKDGGTRVRYDYAAEVSGKVAAVGSRMLEGAAKMVLNQLFEQLGREAGGTGAQAATTTKPSFLARLLAFFGIGK